MAPAERAFKPERARRTIGVSSRLGLESEAAGARGRASLPGRATLSDAGSEEQLAVRHADRDYAIGTFGNYLLAVWRTEVSPQATMHWSHVFNELRGSLPGARFGTLSYLEPTCRVPVAPEATQSFVDMLRRNGDVLKGAAVVYSREGFWGAGIRSQMTSVITESKAEIPYFLALTIESGVTWLMEVLGDSAQGKAAALQRNLEALRNAPTMTSDTTR